MASAFVLGVAATSTGFALLVVSAIDAPVGDDYFPIEVLRSRCCPHERLPSIVEEIGVLMASEAVAEYDYLLCPATNLNIYFTR
jgi:hypothetical protein